MSNLHTNPKEDSDKDSSAPTDICPDCEMRTVWRDECMHCGWEASTLKTIADGSEGGA
jgi:hypothetical protein